MALNQIDEEHFSAIAASSNEFSKLVHFASFTRHTGLDNG